jgi:hypothetical protein
MKIVTQMTTRRILKRKIGSYNETVKIMSTVLKKKKKKKKKKERKKEKEKVQAEHAFNSTAQEAQASGSL